MSSIFKQLHFFNMWKSFTLVHQIISLQSELIVFKHKSRNIHVPHLDDNATCAQSGGGQGKECQLRFTHLSNANILSTKISQKKIKLLFSTQKKQTVAFRAMIKKKGIINC